MSNEFNLVSGVKGFVKELLKFEPNIDLSSTEKIYNQKLYEKLTEGVICNLTPFCMFFHTNTLDEDLICTMILVMNRVYLDEIYEHSAFSVHSAMNCPKRLINNVPNNTISLGHPVYKAIEVGASLGLIEMIMSLSNFNPVLHSANEITVLHWAAGNFRGLNHYLMIRHFINIGVDKDLKTPRDCRDPNMTAWEILNYKTKDTLFRQNALVIIK